MLLAVAIYVVFSLFLRPALMGCDLYSFIVFYFFFFFFFFLFPSSSSSSSSLLLLLLLLMLVVSNIFLFLLLLRSLNTVRSQSDEGSQHHDFHCRHHASSKQRPTAATSDRLESRLLLLCIKLNPS